MKIQNVWIKGKAYQLVSDFRDDAEMRKKFYKLPKELFGVDFESWYEAGYGGAWYNPHCLLSEGEVVSNVGVAHQEYRIDGQIKKIIQLCGVGTWNKYRGGGLARYLMEYIIKTYQNQSDVMMLFGNDSVLDFYPKFGFERTKEYCAVQYVNKTSEHYEIKRLDPMNKLDRVLVRDKVKGAYQSAYLSICNNQELLALHWEICKGVTLYYIKELDTIVVAEYEENLLKIDEVYGEATLQEVIEAMCKQEHTKVILGFTPSSLKGYELEHYQEEDTTLFILGKEFRVYFEEQKLRFPVMSRT